MICPLCNPETNSPNITAFDNSPQHLIIVISPTGECHVHAPFENQAALKTMVRSLQTEMEKRQIPFFNVFGEILEHPKKGSENDGH